MNLQTSNQLIVGHGHKVSNVVIWKSLFRDYAYQICTLLCVDQDTEKVTVADKHTVRQTDLKQYVFNLFFIWYNKYTTSSKGNLRKPSEKKIKQSGHYLQVFLNGFVGELGLQYHIHPLRQKLV